jgi:hypothetical protein
MKVPMKDISRYYGKIETMCADIIPAHVEGYVCLNLENLIGNLGKTFGIIKAFHNLEKKAWNPSFFNEKNVELITTGLLEDFSNDLFSKGFVGYSKYSEPTDIFIYNPSNDRKALFIECFRELLVNLNGVLTQDKVLLSKEILIKNSKHEIKERMKTTWTLDTVSYDETENLTLNKNEFERLRLKYEIGRTIVNFNRSYKTSQYQSITDLMSWTCAKFLDKKIV